jgi:hypothetical protein
MRGRWIMSLAMSVGIIGLCCASLWCAAASAGQPLPPNVGPLVHYVAEVIRSCQGAAYSLWSYNDYSRYRQRQSSILLLHYHPGLVVHARPAIPDELPEPLRAEFAASMDSATDTLRQSATMYKDLSDYVTAKDFEADQYRKGDELNAKLIVLGQKCFAVAKELRAEHRKTAQFILGGFDILDPLVRRMGEDWMSMLPLADELAKGPKADLGRIGALVDQLTALKDKRKQEIAGVTGEGPWPNVFYNNEFDRALVNMRKFLNEAKTRSAQTDAQMADQPRTVFNFNQDLIDLEMSEAFFHALQ